jgi:hypothetical protein
MKLACGILSLNEVELIIPCIESAVNFCDEIFIIDGSMWGAPQTEETIKNTRFSMSTDGTREIINEYAKKCNKITHISLYDEGATIPFEKDVRNIQLAFATAEYFLIIDCDEVYSQEQGTELRELISKNNDIDTFVLTSKLFIKDSYHYINTKYFRLFKINKNRKFIGNNEMSPEGKVKTLDIGFYHYGYLDDKKVKERMKLYNNKIHNFCGDFWYNEIWPFIGKIDVETLIKKNYGTLHPFGKNTANFAAHEWNNLIEDKNIIHPSYIKQYLNNRFQNG